VCSAQQAIRERFNLDREAVSRIVKYMLNHPRLDLVFQALADPTRRDMVERLGRGPASVSELAEPLDMSLPAVLQHLQVLETSGLVSSAKSGRVRTCRLETKALETAEGWFAKRRAIWERRLDRLGDFLAEEGENERRTTRGGKR
jgi:DNA-binding transcriptional ArsR family regulator